MIHEDLWNCIVGDNIDPDQDQHVLTKICLSIKPASYAYVRTAITAKEAWKSFQAIYEDKDLNRRLGLLTSMFNLKLEDHLSTEQYITEAMSLTKKLADIEKPVDDKFLAVVLLHPHLNLNPRSQSQVTHDMLSSDVIKTQAASRCCRKSR